MPCPQCPTYSPLTPALPCPALLALQPPPPPSSPPPAPLDPDTAAALQPSAFPFAACQAREVRTAPWQLLLTASAPVSAWGPTYCFQVRSTRCPAASRCCTMDLAKHMGLSSAPQHLAGTPASSSTLSPLGVSQPAVLDQPCSPGPGCALRVQVELLVGQGCWGAVQSMTVDGLPLAPSYSWALYNGTRQLVFKATRTSGLWPHSAAQGGRLCLTLNAASACPNLSAFCAGYASTGSCRYSLFNQARTCCPTSNVG
ncbi:hypothetical protein QJQ45_018475 [Haematococcus lacustris]|nr:hypothetical protein QJQ45_018475 [Haematococcus lacustris]